jgi:hypothetical protein
VEADETVRLLQSLGDDQARPPMVDLNLAMRTGRKRHHRRRMAATGGSVLAVVAVIAAAPAAIHAVQRKSPAGVGVAASPKASAATAPTIAASPSTPAGPTSLTCVESPLPVPRAGQEGLVTGADPSGRFILGRVYSGGHPTQAAIWDDGKLNTVTIPGSDAEFNDITSEGVAVGASFVSGDTSTAWIYADGHLSKLAGPDGSSAVAIGEQGTIAGTESTKAADRYPIVWRSATSTAVRLPLPSDMVGGQAEDVDSDGTIVGTLLQGSAGVPPGGPLMRGAVWRPDGTVDLLPLPTDLVDGVNGLEIHSIRHGVITAAATVSDRTGKSFTPVTYNLSTREFTLLPAANIWIGAGNARGGIAGNTGSTPAVYTPTTGVVDLPTLQKADTTAPVAGSEVRPGGLARTISDSGLIIGGQDMDENDVIRAVTWTCR